MGSDAKMAELIRRSVEAGAHDLSAQSWLPYMRATWMPWFDLVASVSYPAKDTNQK